MARISIQLDDGTTSLELDACFIRGHELDVNQLGALESAPELASFLAVLQTVAPHELAMAHVLEPTEPPSLDQFELYATELVTSIRRYAAEFQRDADLLTRLAADGVYDFEVRARELAELAVDARSLVEKGPADNERQAEPDDGGDAWYDDEGAGMPDDEGDK